MIQFSCEQCGHKMSVADESAGRQGKCPKCGKILIVPDKVATIVISCKSCGQKISVPRIHAGKKGKCPTCKNPIVVPAVRKPIRKQKQDNPDDTSERLLGNDIGLVLLDVPEELRLADEQIRESAEVEAALEQKPDIEKQSAEDEQTESAERRKLPRFVEIFLYPVSVGGLSTIAIIVLLDFVTDFAAMFLGFCMCAGGILGFIAKILLVYSYLYWYFSECVRDSADGGLRAPEIVGNMASVGDMFWQFLRLFMCFAFFLGPVIFYWGYISYSNNEMNGLIFWALLTYGIFFFPMGTLAVVMFDSVNGLNPVLIIRSIGSVLVRYCLLVILVYGLAVMFIFLNARVRAVLPERGMISLMISSCISFVFSIYALLTVGHLLGRFYYAYQHRLNWEV